MKLLTPLATHRRSVGSAPAALLEGGMRNMTLAAIVLPLLAACALVNLGSEDNALNGNGNPPTDGGSCPAPLPCISQLLHSCDCASGPIYTCHPCSEDCCAYGGVADAGTAIDAGGCPPLLLCGSIGLYACAGGTVEACPSNTAENVCCAYGGVADAGVSGDGGSCPAMPPCINELLHSCSCASGPIYSCYPCSDVCCGNGGAADAG
jgi:hypothetical protein